MDVICRSRSMLLGVHDGGYYAIGCDVKPKTEPPLGYTTVMIPSGYYRIFSVEQGRADKIGTAWQSIWSIPVNEKHNWSFSCEFERYRASGEIDIFIGTKSE